MRRADRLQKTMSALRCCVEQSRREPSPWLALEHRLAELRISPDFSAAEIDQIETAARRALAACVAPGPWPPGHHEATALVGAVR